jgi:hypothetical protein
MFLFAGLYRFTHAVLNKKEVSERFAITKMSWAESLSHLLKQTTSSNTNLSSTFSWAFSEFYPRWQFSELKSRWNFPSPILEVFRFLKHRWLYSEFKTRWLYSEFKTRWLYSEFKPRWLYSEFKRRWLYSEFKPRWLYSEFKPRWLYSELEPRWKFHWIM